MVFPSLSCFHPSLSSLSPRHDFFYWEYAWVSDIWTGWDIHGPFGGQTWSPRSGADPGPCELPFGVQALPLISWGEWKQNWRMSCRGVQPAAQDGCECGPTQIVNFLKTLWDFLVITCRNVFNMWPKTTLLPVWCRDAKRLDTRGASEWNFSHLFCVSGGDWTQLNT